MTAAFKARARKFLYHNVLHADDTPHQIALGVGIGTLVAFLPLIGVQTVLSVALAGAVRANKAVCIPIVWITNPLTAVPIYGSFWKLGSWLTGSSDTGAFDAFVLAFRQDGGPGQLLQPAFWSEFFNLLIGIGTDLWVGSAVASVVLAIFAYFLSLWALSSYRQRVRAHLARLRAVRREARRARKALHLKGRGGSLTGPIPASKP